MTNEITNDMAHVKSLKLGECEYDLKNLEQAREYYIDALIENRYQQAYIYFKIAQTSRGLGNDYHAIVNFKLSCQVIINHQLKFTSDYVEFFEYSMNVLEILKLNHFYREDFVLWKMACQNQLALNL